MCVLLLPPRYLEDTAAPGLIGPKNNVDFALKIKPEAIRISDTNRWFFHEESSKSARPHQRQIRLDFSVERKPRPFSLGCFLYRASPAVYRLTPVFGETVSQKRRAQRTQKEMKAQQRNGDFSFRISLRFKKYPQSSFTAATRTPALAQCTCLTHGMK